MKLTSFVRAALAAAALFATAAPGLAMDAMVTKAGDLEISGGYSRATLPNAPVGAGFLTIVNSGSTADRLVGATSPVTDQVQLHEMAMEGGVMKMRQLKDGIPIPAGATVKLDPSNLHLMFMHLNQPLREGTAIEVTLSFEKAGKITVPLTVGGIAAKAMPGMSMVDHVPPPLSWLAATEGRAEPESLMANAAGVAMMVDASLIKPKA